MFLIFAASEGVLYAGICAHHGGEVEAMTRAGDCARLGRERRLRKGSLICLTKRCVVIPCLLLLRFSW